MVGGAGHSAPGSDWTPCPDPLSPLAAVAVTSRERYRRFPRQSACTRPARPRSETVWSLSEIDQIGEFLFSTKTPLCRIFPGRPRLETGFFSSFSLLLCCPDASAHESPHAAKNMFYFIIFMQINQSFFLLQSDNRQLFMPRQVSQPCKLSPHCTAAAYLQNKMFICECFYWGRKKAIFQYLILIALPELQLPRIYLQL